MPPWNQTTSTNFNGIQIEICETKSEQKCHSVSTVTGVVKCSKHLTMTCERSPMAESVIDIYSPRKREKCNSFVFSTQCKLNKTNLPNTANHLNIICMSRTIHVSVVTTVCGILDSCSGNCDTACSLFRRLINLFIWFELCLLLLCQHWIIQHIDLLIEHGFTSAPTQ